MTATLLVASFIGLCGSLATKYAASNLSGHDLIRFDSLQCLPVLTMEHLTRFNMFFYGRILSDFVIVLCIIQPESIDFDTHLVNCDPLTFSKKDPSLCHRMSAPCNR